MEKRLNMYDFLFNMRFPRFDYLFANPASLSKLTSSSSMPVATTSASLFGQSISIFGLHRLIVSWAVADLDGIRSIVSIQNSVAKQTILLHDIRA